MNRISLFATGLLLVAQSSWGEVKFESLALRADRTFDLTLKLNNVAQTVRGSLRENEAAPPVLGKGFSANLRSYEGKIVTILVLPDHQAGAMFMLELRNATLVTLNEVAIRIASARPLEDLDDIVDRLNRERKVGIVAALQPLVDYFNKNPGKDLSFFYDLLERDAVQLAGAPMPQPLPAQVAADSGSNSGSSPATANTDPGETSEDAEASAAESRATAARLAERGRAPRRGSADELNQRQLDSLRPPNGRETYGGSRLPPGYGPGYGPPGYDPSYGPGYPPGYPPGVAPQQAGRYTTGPGYMPPPARRGYYGESPQLPPPAQVFQPNPYYPVPNGQPNW